MSKFWVAFSVHMFTALGAALALMAILEAGRMDWPRMFGWLLLALLVDGADGPMARLAQTKLYAPQWDGDLLDLIIDFLTYVFIPAYALVEANVIGVGWSLAAGLLIVTTGAVYFADTRMKMEDKSFSGFPGCWNMVILALFAIDIGSWAAMFLIIGIALAQFFSLKFVHPVRTARWRWVTLPVMAAWTGFAAWLTWNHFEGPAVAQIGLTLTSIYLLFAGIAQQLMPRV